MALVSRNSAGSSTFYSFDPQGSTAQRLTGAGAVLTSSETDAFGSTAGAASGDPYTGYCAEYGYYNDPETGLLLLGHRYYDSGTGRFINRDPLGYAGGVDLYGYCRNEVGAILCDPTGRCCSGLSSTSIDYNCAAAALAVGGVAVLIIAAILGTEPELAPWAAALVNCIIAAITGGFIALCYDAECSGTLDWGEIFAGALTGCLLVIIPSWLFPSPV